MKNHSTRIATALASVVLLASCNGAFQLPSLGELSISLGEPASRSLGARVPDYVTVVDITVSAPDMEPIPVSLTDGQIEISIPVPAGENRTVSATARTSAGVEVYSGSTEVTVEAGRTTAVLLTMERLFSSNFQFHGFDVAANGGLVSAAPTGVIDYPAVVGSEVAATPTANGFDASVFWFADVTSLGPTLTVGEGATVSPSDGSDFSSDVVYTVTTPDGKTADYTVRVVKSGDMTALLTAISAAETAIQNAVFNDPPALNEHPSAAQTEYETAVADARAVAADATADQAAVDAAVAALDAARLVFEGRQVVPQTAEVEIDFTDPALPQLVFNTGTSAVRTFDTLQIAATTGGVPLDDTSTGIDPSSISWTVNLTPTGDANTAQIQLDPTELQALGIGTHFLTVEYLDTSSVAQSSIFPFAIVDRMLSDADAVTADAAAIQIEYAGFDDASQITSPVGLPFIGPNGSYVAWDASGHPSISDTGDITPPSPSSGGSVGDLVATVSRGAESATATFAGLRVTYQPLATLYDPTYEQSQITGASVDMTDSYMVVGVPQDSDAAIGAGKVVIFEWDPVARTWTNPFEILGSSENGFFGWSVAIDGDFVAIGAWQDKPGSINTGAVHVYQRTGPGNNWTTDPTYGTLDPAALSVSPGFGSADKFGYSVDISLPYIAVGAVQYGPNHELSGDPGGAAVVYRQAGTANRWDGAAPVLIDPTLDTASDTAARFGAAVALNGDYLAVGATHTEIAGQTTAGEVYVYTRSATDDWLTEPVVRLDATAEPLVGPSQNAFFGDRLSMAADGTLAVGAPNATPIGGPADANHGAVYVFTPGTWALEGAFSPTNLGVLARFGGGVDILQVSGGHRLAVGASLANGGDAVDSTDTGRGGRAYIWSSTGGSWQEFTQIRLYDNGGNTSFGEAVALSPSGQLAVSATSYNGPGGSSEGAVFVYE